MLLKQALFSPVARRAGWTLGDQVLSSVSNFALGVVLARTLEPRGFGAFSLGFAAYLLILGASRALGSAVLQVRFTAAAGEAQRGAIRDATGVPLVISTALLLPLTLVASLVRGEIGQALGALAIVLPGLLLQDAWRFAFFSADRARGATVNDLVWVVMQFWLLAAVLALGEVTVSSAVLTWGFGAYIAAIVGVVQARIIPSARGALRWLVNHRDLGVPTLGEFLLISATTPVTLLLLGALAGLGEVASYRAAQIVLGPLNILSMAAVLLAVPEAARLYATRPTRLPHALGLGATAFAVIALCFAALGLVLPTWVGESLVGPNWAEARPLLTPLAVHVAAAGLMSSWGTGLRVLGAAHEAFVQRLVLTSLYLTATVSGILWADAEGAAVGTAIASVVGATMMRRLFKRCFRRRQSLDEADEPETARTSRSRDLPGPVKPTGGPTDS